jgi:hypothetical protein
MIASPLSVSTNPATLVLLGKVTVGYCRTIPPAVTSK